MKWQVTMTTLWCDIVGDWVTVLVYADGSTKCSHFTRYGPMTRKIKEKGGSKRELSCNGPTCDLCLSYKEKVFRREAEEARV